MFKRKVYEKLLKWKETSNGRTAILVEGARRIGKSTVVEEFAKNEYQDYLMLDFSIESDDVKNVFLNKIDNIEDFYRYLFLYKDKNPMAERKSLIIFDEVQLFPKARQAIKHLVKDGRYDFIETGSLISIKKNVKDILIPSEETKLKMYPMDFEEFLWAVGNTVAIDLIKEAYKKRKPLGELAHRKIMTLFREYLAVGGMPQAVSAFVDGASFSEIDRIKYDIVKLYEEDLNKNNDNGKSKNIYKSVPSQLGKNKKRFTLAQINKNSRFRDYADSIDFVCESMILNSCNNVSDPGLFLELSKVDEKFKLYMGDTGLLITCIANNKEIMDENIYKLIISDKTSDNLGMVYENMAAQILRSKGYSLYFHEFYDESPRKKSNGEDTYTPKRYEIDFLIVKNKKLCPIEIKSGKSKKHESFDVFKEKYKLKIQEKYVVHTKDFEIKDGITYIPIYMLGWIDD